MLEQEEEKRIVDTKSNVFSDDQIKKFSDYYRRSRKKNRKQNKVKFKNCLLDKK
jgi:hypothetical protein